MKKSQAPSSKLQRNSKLRAAMADRWLGRWTKPTWMLARVFGVWDLQFLWNFELGAWSFFVRRLCPGLLVMIVASLFARAQDSNSTSRLDYSSFRIVSERNIFNPNRSSRSNRNTRTDSERRVKIESFALVGTMSYEKGY